MEKIKVIIVDDDRIVLSGMTTMVDWGQFGFEVVATAINGRQGISRFQEFSPHVVFSDIIMPVMDGLKMLETIRQEATFTRFIVLSAFGEFAYAKQAIELGAKAYILKSELNPATLTTLLEQIRSEIVSQSRQSFETILETVHSFVEIGELSLDSAIIKIEGCFVQYLDLQKPNDLGTLANSIDIIFRRGYDQYGKSGYYTPPASATSGALKQWVVEQMRKVDGWRIDFKLNLTPVVANAVFYMREHFAETDFTVHEVSEHVGMSDGRLSVLFKQETGKTMKEYITLLRIAQAKKLLRRGQFRVYEVAEMVGFTSAEYFSRLFSKVTGSPPQYYWKDDDH